MRARINPEYLGPIAVVTAMVLVVAACAIQLPKDEVGDEVTSPAPQETDSFAARLDHCRTVTSEQTAELESCRRIWAENRRRFFTSTKPNWSASPEEMPEPAPTTKYRDRVLPPALNDEQNGTR
jgi:conjugative transfer region protein TrbK